MECGDKESNLKKTRWRFALLELGARKFPPLQDSVAGTNPGVRHIRDLNLEEKSHFRLVLPCPSFTMLFPLMFSTLRPRSSP
jgi:hypothetical protein